MRSDADGCMSATSVLSELACFASALFFRLDYFLATVHCEKYVYSMLWASPRIPSQERMQRDASACHPEHSIKIDNVMRGRERHIIWGVGVGDALNYYVCIRAY